MPEKLVSVRFRVNDDVVDIGEDVSSTTKLSTFLRSHLRLTGLKVACGEGGCGSCVVLKLVQKREGSSAELLSINSCLIHVIQCDGWSIFTIEYSKKANALSDFMKRIQQSISENHGTQCGFCTPGFVMSTLHGKLKMERESRDDMKDVFDGHICRCTGYRPIFDAAKNIKECPVKDIEDHCSLKSSMRCGNSTGCSIWKWKDENGVIHFKPSSLRQLHEVYECHLKSLDTNQIHFSAANTSYGIYKCQVLDSSKKVDVNLCNVDEMKILEWREDVGFNIGAASTITEVIDFVEVNMINNDLSDNWRNVVNHMKLIGGTSLRNSATVGGNIMIKKDLDANFPSDLFTIFNCLGVHVKLYELKSDKIMSGIPLYEWFSSGGSWPANQYILVSLTLPNFVKNQKFNSYKVTIRAQNAHAYVNAAFEFTPVVGFQRGSLKFGGLGPLLLSCTETENFIRDNELKVSGDLRGWMESMKVLDAEIRKKTTGSDQNIGEYEKLLAVSLYYKFLLELLKPHLRDDTIASGSEKMVRKMVRGSQSFETVSDMFPVSEPIPKLESRIQCSGEAEYTDDIPSVYRECFAYFVLSDRSNSVILEIDTSQASKVDGYIDFISYKDILGVNNFSPGAAEPELIFAENFSSFAGQSIGLVLAESFELSRKAAKLVRIKYEGKEEEETITALNIRDCLLYGHSTPQNMPVRVERHEVVQKLCSENEKLTDADDNVVVVKGELEIGSQYHFHMEAQVCLVRPIENDQLEVFSSTQHMNGVQRAISLALNMKMHNIDMRVRRLGGAFGGKISRPNLIGAACAVACKKVGRGVRLVLDLQTNMQLCGKRLPYLGRYTVHVHRETMKLKHVEMELICDCGFAANESTCIQALPFCQSVYHSESWKVSPISVRTNTPPNTYCRAPGSTQGHAIMENIMEHVAFSLNVDPLEFRMKNVLQHGDPYLVPCGPVTSVSECHATLIRRVIQSLMASGEVNKRKKEVREWNSKNKWIKRGLSVVPVKYNHMYWDNHFHMLISVYCSDGSIAISSGGIEMGQGINTKVAQTVAKTLNVEMDMIKIKVVNNLVAVNDSDTAGSQGSECCCMAAEKACLELKSRMYKDIDKFKDVDPNDWKSVVKSCWDRGVDLTGRHMTNPPADDLQPYFVWGAVATEVEVDILTGQSKVVRSDLVEDTGTSTNPAVDLGQIEGGFVMSLGLWTCEEIRRDPQTGVLLTDSTWTYKPPSSLDIPEDLRISLFNSNHNKPVDGNASKLVLGSKVTGEPSVLMGCSVFFAIREAVMSARRDFGLNHQWIELNSPATPHAIKVATGIDHTKFSL